MRLNRILPLLALVLLTACVNVTGSAVHEQVLYVAPYTRTCMGMYEMQCMLVREDPDDEWGNWYTPIEGFEYEPGYHYTLLVGWREIPNPPADGSSRAYWLIRIVEKTQSTP